MTPAGFTRKGGEKPASALRWPDGPRSVLTGVDLPVRGVARVAASVIPPTQRRWSGHLTVPPSAARSRIPIALDRVRVNANTFSFLCEGTSTVVLREVSEAR